MDLCIKELLKDDIFKGAEILAGAGGLSRRCQRVSVFDCPYHENLLSKGIIRTGDLFLSCLEQFQDGRGNMRGFSQSLVFYHSAGLLLLPTASVDVLDQQTLAFFEQNDFPVIWLKINFSYGDIMTTINNLLHYSDENEINLSRLNRLLQDGLSPGEKKKLLFSINPEFEEYIRAIFVKGPLLSQWMSSKLLSDCKELHGYSILLDRDYTLVLLSGKDQKQLRIRSNVIAGRLDGYFSEYHIGYSRIHHLDEIAEVLHEGELAVRVSDVLHVPQQSYDPLLTHQLIFTLQNSLEAHEFYNAYVKAVAQGISGNMLDDYLHTVELFVAHKGNYKQVAEALNQHVNTIRYRINRIKQSLGMEDDAIRFYETISLATKLGICFGSESLNFLQKSN